MLSVVATEIIDDIINVIIDSGINKIATDENIKHWTYDRPHICGLKIQAMIETVQRQRQ